MSNDEPMVPTIPGKMSYDRIQREIASLGCTIGAPHTGDSKMINTMRIKSMRAYLDLFEEYTESLPDD